MLCLCMLVFSKQKTVIQCLWNKQTYGWMDEWMSSQRDGQMDKFESLILLPVKTHCTWHAKLGSQEGYHLLIPKSLNTLPSSPASHQSINTGSCIS